MPLPSLSFARLLGLSALLFSVLVGCGEEDPKPPPSSQSSPDASRSSVAADLATGIRADGADRVTLTITVRDGTGKPLSGRTVSVEVSGEGNTVTQPEGTTNASGVVTASVVSSQPGEKRVTASVEAEGGAVVLSEQPTLRFVSAPAVKLVFLTTISSATAGEPLEPVLEVAVQDQLGRTITSASNEVSLLLAAGPASSGIEGTLTAQAINGVARFPRVVLKKAGPGYRLKATSSGLADAASPLFEVVPALPASLVLGMPAAATAGTTVNAMVMIRDSFGNVATNYTGTVRFTSTAPGAELPADFTFTAADQGTKAFSFTLSKAGNWQVRVEDITDLSLAATSSVSVLPAAAAQFSLTAAPGPLEAGEEFSLEVVAQDAFGNVATGYEGTVHFTSTDPAAQLPADYTFSVGDEGRQSFIVVLETVAASQQITVTDTALPSLTATLDREIVTELPVPLRGD